MIIIALRTNGATSNIERVHLYKDAGATSGTEGDPITGLTHNSTGLSISTIANNEATATTETVAGTDDIEDITTLGTYSAPTAGKCRFKEVDATGHPGLYEIQLADARYAVSSAKYLDICITGVADLATFHGRIYLDTIDAAGIRSAVGLASANLDTQIADLPTNAELAARTVLAATYATSTATDTIEAAIEDLTDGTSPVHADVRLVRGTTLTGAGTEGDPWGP